MKALIIAVILGCFCGGEASAQGWYLSSPGGGNVFVWKSKSAQSEAVDLISSGVHRTNPALVARLMSCMVPSGTPIIISSKGIITDDVMVIGGASAGCRGNVAAEYTHSSR